MYVQYICYAFCQMENVGMTMTTREGRSPLLNDCDAGPFLFLLEAYIRAEAYCFRSRFNLERLSAWKPDGLGHSIAEGLVDCGENGYYDDFALSPASLSIGTCIYAKTYVVIL